MLIRVRHGSSGIREYLENGQKSGREYTRDELDRRVPFAGNLDQIDDIIESMKGSGKKYMHVTLAFKEDYISDEVMNQIVEEFRRFAFSAYKADEYDFYAEAHVPILKSYRHAKSGKLIERRPHIHIVIPQTNLVSGMHLNPLGRVEYQEKFYDAFQEHINNKFGLASPKDNPNLHFNDASEMFSRYSGGDLKAGSNDVRDLKKDILRRVVEERIESWDGFRTLLAEYGTVRTRREGTGRDYFNLVPDPARVGFEPIRSKTGDIKGINFNEIRFERASIEAPTHAKAEAISEVVRAEYLEAAAARRDPEHIAATLARWHECRALEVRHIFSQNAAYRDRYKAATPDEQRAMLAEQIERIEAKNQEAQRYLDEALAEPEDDHEHDRNDPYNDRAALSDPRRAAALRLTYLAEIAARPEAESFNDLRTLSSSGMDFLTDEGPAELLPGDAHQRLEAEGAERLDALRRGGDGEPAARTTDAERGIGETDPPDLTPATLEAQLAADEPVQPGNVVEHLWREQQEARDIERAEPTMTEIRQQLDAARLLAHVSHTQGVLVDKYEVVKHKDGSDRIRCGTRHYNVSDFLTKELRMNYAQVAEPILRECFAGQQISMDVQPAPEPQRGLWMQFRNWRDGEGKTVRDAAWSNQSASERERMAELRNVFQDAKRELYRAARGRRASGYGTEKAAELSRIRAEYAIKQTMLRADIRRERAEFTERYRFNQMYRDWLRERGQQGDEKALTELRRQTLRQSAQERTKDRSTVIQAAPDVQPRGEAVLLQHVTYAVDRSGDVTYRADGRDLFRDERNRVAIFEHSADTLEAALRLSVQKFGATLALRGAEEFKRRCVEVAVQRGLRIEFCEPALNDYAEQLKAEAARDRAAARAPRVTPAATDPLRAIEDALSPQLRELLEEERRQQRHAQHEQDDEKKPSRDTDYDLGM